ncbi:MAG TPA: dihydrolipoamide acetyltransferase family protein, partial [Kribbella sp.]
MTTQTFLLPDLGEGLTEAEIVRWLVAVGDVVAVDAPVAEVETAKSIVEVPSPYAGVVAELHGVEGGTVDVGKPLITIAAELPAAETYREEEKAGSGNVLIGYGTPEVGGVTRRRRSRGVNGSVGLAETVVVEPVRPAVPLVISPLVRRLARDAKVDLHALTGSGSGGVITRRDVEAAIASNEPASATAPAEAEPSTAPAQVGPAVGRAEGAPATAPAQAGPVTGRAEAVPAPAPARVGLATGRAEAVPATRGAEAAVAAGAAMVAAAGGAAEADSRTGLGELRRIPMSGFRKAVAATLSRSRAEIPEATTWVDVDATELMELRESLRTATDPGPGLLALMARFVVAGLQKYPELNGFVDTEHEELVQYDGINLGLAAQTERGLVVPAVAGAHAMTTRGLDAEIRRLTASARDGRLTARELSCGTFTLNNYGSFGV